MLRRICAAALPVLLVLPVLAGLLLPVWTFAQGRPTLPWEPTPTVSSAAAPACLDPARPTTIVAAEAAGTVADMGRAAAAA